MVIAISVSINCHNRERTVGGVSLSVCLSAYFIPSPNRLQNNLIKLAHVTLLIYTTCVTSARLCCSTFTRHRAAPHKLDRTPLTIALHACAYYRCYRVRNTRRRTRVFWHTHNSLLPNTENGIVPFDGKYRAHKRRAHPLRHG